MLAALLLAPEHDDPPRWSCRRENALAMVAAKELSLSGELDVPRDVPPPRVFAAAGRPPEALERETFNREQAHLEAEACGA